MAADKNIIKAEATDDKAIYLRAIYSQISIPESKIRQFLVTSLLPFNVMTTLVPITLVLLLHETLNLISSSNASSVTRLGDLFYFGQFFKAFGNN